MTNTTENTYRLGSNAMIFAPGVVRWAANGYSWPKDRANMVRIIAEGWGVPDEAAHALLSGKAPYTVEDDAVVFSHAAEPQRKRFIVKADYATKAGRKGSWTWRMASTWATIIADAERHVAKHRPGSSKVDISATCLD